jgi:putative addiction module CopG family antidote
MSVTVALPSHIQTWIDQQIEAGRFASEEQVIVEALERMADDRRIPPELLDELIAAPLAQIERGEGQKWTPKLRERIKADAIANADRGHEVRDEIKY